MAVHSFASIEEIRSAKTSEERASTQAKVLKESRDFDTFLRNALERKDPTERAEALLQLESRHEFKRSHPTVEVRTYRNADSEIISF